MQGKSTSSYNVLTSYIYIENLLFDILQIIPYCKEHENVWSPRFVTILRESCSQLASLWEFEARKSQYVPKNDLKITHFFEYFGEAVAPKWVVFWAEEPVVIKPYESWANAKGFKLKNYKPLDWWTTYTNLKHKAYSNLTQATLRQTAYSLAALFIAILKSGSCSDAINQAGWFYSDFHNPAADLNDENTSEQKPGYYFTVESRLFSYAVGWSKVSISRKDQWVGGNSSPRFIAWFDQFSNQPE
jgi:hypothetical protein